MQVDVLRLFSRPVTARWLIYQLLGYYRLLLRAVWCLIRLMAVYLSTFARPSDAPQMRNLLPGERLTAPHGLLVCSYASLVPSAPAGEAQDACMHAREMPAWNPPHVTFGTLWKPSLSLRKRDFRPGNTFLAFWRFCALAVMVLMVTLSHGLGVRIPGASRNAEFPAAQCLRCVLAGCQ